MEKEQLLSTVTAAQNGDNDALNTLFNEYYNDLYYFALKTVKDEETALDVTQEAFVEIINTLSNLKEPAAFVTWAKQITYHQCTRYFKKKKDVIVDEDEDGNTVFDTLQEENTEFIPDEALDQSDFKKTVMAILDELSEEQRSATMMYYFDELSVRQIAEIQGVSEGTIKSRLNYARKAIKASVEDYEKKNGIKLHAIAFFPFFKWLFEGSFEGGMPVASAKLVAEGVTTATGATVSVATATATTGAVVTTTTAVGIGAKIAAMPLVTKVVACIVAGVIAVGGGATAVILSQKDKSESTNNQSIVSSNDDSSSETNDELVLEGVIPEGCTYTLYDGTVLTVGQKFPEICTAGDKVSYGDYLYGYECIYTKNIDGTDTWHMWKDGFDSGDSGVIESDVFGSWSVMVADQTKTSYSVIVSKINGKPIKTLYGTFFGCTNMTEAPKIPSTITAMPSAYLGCSSLVKAPKIPANVERIMMSFNECTSLAGDVVIDAKLDKSLEWYYSDTFSGTKNKINLTGNTPEEDLILIAKLSDNKNITVNGKRVDYGSSDTSDTGSTADNNSVIDDNSSQITDTSSDATSSNTYEIVEDSIYSAYSRPVLYSDSNEKYYIYPVNIKLLPNAKTVLYADGTEIAVNYSVVCLYQGLAFTLISQDETDQIIIEDLMYSIKDGCVEEIPTTATWDELFTNETYFKKMSGQIVNGKKYIPHSSGGGSDVTDFYEYSIDKNGNITLTEHLELRAPEVGYSLSNMVISKDKKTITATIAFKQGDTQNITLSLANLD